MSITIRHWSIGVLIAASIALVPETAAAESKKFALVIGIKGYPAFRDNPLQFGDNDAKEFAEFLQTEEGGGFPASNVRVLRNGDAKRADIFRELRWLQQVVKGSEDLVYIFFSGHGVADENHQVYFMPYDADPAVPEALGIRADELIAAVRGRISPKQLLFFIDACHAAAAVAPGGTSKAGTESPIAEEFKKKLEAAPEVNMAFLSAASNELSHEDPSLKHGLFTWFLLDGLKGGADVSVVGNRDGVVTADELFRYLHDRVPMRSRALHKVSQTPIVSAGFVGTFPLSRPGVSADPPASQARGGTIQDALDSFRDGYQTKNIALLLSIFPKFQGIDRLRKEFDDFEGVAMAISPPVIRQLSETTAIATCARYSITFTTKTGKVEQTKPRKAEFEMRKDGLTWVIDSVQFR